MKSLAVRLWNPPQSCAIALLLILASEIALAQVEPVTASEINEMRQAFRSAGLTQADVVPEADGRVSLGGEYENREQVELAFAAARAIVGLRRVAPTTPTSIKYRLKGFDRNFASAVERMMRKPEPPAQPVVPPQPSPKSVVPPPPKTAAPQPQHRTPQTYAVSVGVGRFKNLPPDSRLEFTGKDARDFHRFLTAPSGGGVARDHAKLFIDQDANSSALQAELQRLLQITEAGDTVVMFVASHGVPNALGKFDIVLYDTELSMKKVSTGKGDPLELAVTNQATTLSDEYLASFIAQLVLKDVRSVIVLDTCYSGKTFATVPGFLPSRTRSLTQYKNEVSYATAPPDQAMADLVQKAKDLKATRIVIVSASENEQSLETPDEGGGMFTQLYLKSLQKIHDYADAFDVAKPIVIKRSRTFGQSQTPRLLVVPEEAVTKM